MRICLTSFLAGIAFLGLSLPVEVNAAEISSRVGQLQLAQTTPAGEPETTDTDITDDSSTDDAQPGKSDISADNPPEVIKDLSAIPFPVKKMRDLILEAAKTGDVEKLRPYIGYGDDVTMLSLGGFDDDPIEFLKSLSGDPEGQEILAIMSEILEAPLVRLHPETEEEVYVWPYFYSYPSEKLTPAQRVELFRIITYGDYEEMENFGNYIFYRIGITPQGRWRFFVAGD